jgi:hypothetical protein
MKVGGRKVDRVVLEIDWSYSYCLACGKNADPDEESHTTRLGGYSGTRGRGCGRKYTHVTTRHVDKKMMDVVKKMRPDLDFIALNGLPEAELFRRGHLPDS